MALYSWWREGVDPDRCSHCGFDMAETSGKYWPFAAGYGKKLEEGLR
jgi:ribosomal protein L37E